MSKREAATPSLEIRGEVLYLSGDWNAKTVGVAERAWKKAGAHPTAAVDGTAIAEMDSLGAVLIRRYAGEGTELRGFDERSLALIEMAGAQEEAVAPAGHRRSRFSLEAIGGGGYGALSRLSGITILIVDILYWGLVSVFDRKQVRKGSFVEQAFQMGASALPITATILFLIGAILTLQSAAQLRQFGVTIYVVNLLAIGLAREFAPLMTAIIISGRSGSAIASEIATMKFTEELDAIRTLGLNPIRFVVVPKLWAMLVSMPLLTIAALFIGLIGGLVVALLYMEMPPATFLNQLGMSLLLRDVVTGLIKSVSFAAIITVSGTYHGLAFTGGADGVGRATTRAVVTSIFAIIAMDSFWGIVFYMKF
jgi:phospholipid/cholesterol/gamma-HCH transport system permease protein